MRRYFLNAVMNWNIVLKGFDIKSGLKLGCFNVKSNLGLCGV